MDGVRRDGLFPLNVEEKGNWFCQSLSFPLSACHHTVVEVPINWKPANVFLAWFLHTCERRKEPDALGHGSLSLSLSLSLCLSVCVCVCVCVGVTAVLTA